MGKRRDWFSGLLKKTLICTPTERKKKKSLTLGECWGKQRSLHSTSSGAANAVVVPANNPPVVEMESTAAKDDQIMQEHSVALATVDAAHVEQIPAGAHNLGGMDKEVAAIQIQSAFRGYLAREALREMKALAKLKSLSDGQCTKRQSATALKYAQMRGHLQSEVPSTRIKMLKNNSGLERQTQHIKKLDEPKASAEDRFGVHAKNKTILDPNNPRWSWNLSKEWMAAHPRTKRRPIEQVNSGHVTLRSCTSLSMTGEGDTKLQSPRVRNPTQISQQQSPSTPNSGRLRQPSPRFLTNAKNDESNSITSIQSERCRRYSRRGSSIDDTSLVSCPAYAPGYMASTVASRAKTRGPSLLGRTPVKAAGGSARRRLSFSVDPAPAAAASLPPGRSASPKMDAMLYTKYGVQTHNEINS